MFVTFVMKDAYRESLSELARSISQAERDERSANEFNSLRALSEEILTHFKSIAVVDSKGKHLNSQEELIAEVFREVNSDYKLRQDFDSVRTLINALPEDPETGPESENRKRFNEINDLLEDMRKESAQYDRLTVGDLQHPAETLYFRRHINDKARRLSESIDSLRASVIRHADRRRETLEKQTRILTIASYVLYPFGWLLALMSKMYSGDLEDAYES